MKGRGGIREVFSGTAGELSSKRTMMFLSFLVMLAIAYVSIFLGRPVEQFIFDGFLYIVVGSLFSVASEKFSQRFVKTEKFTRYESGDDSYYDDENFEPDGSEYQSNMNRWENDDI